MKKPIFVLIFAVFYIFGIFSQSVNSSGPIDLVVILDTSSSMSGSYRETSNYLIGPFLQEHLRIGDTFHLISFSGTPRLEISRRIEGSGDVETIIARLLLMYPLYPESNISTALNYAENFASSLPNRSKKVVLISDGDAENTQNIVNESSTRFRRLGAELQYIKVPVTGNSSVTTPAPQAPAGSQTAQSTQPTQAEPTQAAQTQQTTQTTQSGQSTQPTQAAQTVQSGQTTQPAQNTQSGQTTQPTQATQTAQSGQTTQPAQNTQSGQEQNTQSTQAAQTEQATETTRPSESTQQTQSPSPGESPQASGQATTQESGTSGSTQAQAPVQSQAQSAQGSSGGRIPLPVIIGLGLLLLLLLIGIIIFASRRLHKSPNRVLAKATAPGPSAPGTSAVKKEPFTAASPKKVTESRKTDNSLTYPPPKIKPLPKDKVYDENTFGNGGSVLLNLFVEDQNTAIGKRNIHMLKPGYSFTIGGGKSDFLIFLVPVPPRIADVSYDGRNCVFIPRKPQYFPDIGSQTIPNCIGKTFRVISDRKYELHIRLERYEDPLQALNKLFRSIKAPGPVV